MGTQQEKIDKNLRNVKAYYASQGLNDIAINKLISKSCMRDIDLIEIRIQDYMDLWHVDRKTVWATILKFPRLLGMETKGKHIPNSVESRMQNWQTTFQLDKPTLIKKVLTGTSLLSVCNLQSMIDNYKKILQTDEATVKKILLKQPSLAYLDIEDNVVPTLKFYRDTLKIDQPTLTKMVLQNQRIIGFNIETSLTSVKSKIDKLKEVMPLAELREKIIAYPMILNTPAQAFKVRYMLAALADDYIRKNQRYTGKKEKFSITERFFKTGYMTGQDKVWARFNYLVEHNFKAMNYLYYGDSQFQQWVRAPKNADLIKKYPLDANALNQIEQKYNQIKGKSKNTKKLRHLKFDPQELAAYHMKRSAAELIVPDDMSVTK